MNRFSLALVLLLSASSIEAFVGPTAFLPRMTSLRMAEDKAAESAFKPPDEETDEETLEKVEMLGKGAAKVRMNDIRSFKCMMLVCMLRVQAEWRLTLYH